MLQEIDTAFGVLAVNVREGNAVIEYYRGKDVSVEIPARVEISGEEYPVTEILKKAFVGAKSVNRIVVPSTVVKVGDWAFASCTELTEVLFERADIVFGNSVFKDCKKLERIALKEESDSEEDEDIFYMLAAAVSKLDASYLLNLKAAGSSDWTEHFDSTVEKFLRKDDSEGFSAMLLCGEEDYVGDDSNYDTFCLMRVKEKVRVLLIRLLHDRGLSDYYRDTFSKYMIENMTKAVWPVVLSEHGDDREYFDVLIDCKCIDENNISELIASMGDRNSGMKGYLLKYKGEKMSANDFFDDLEL